MNWAANIKPIDFEELNRQSLKMYETYTESFHAGRHVITRVPGGMIYKTEYHGANPDCIFVSAATSCFVPDEDINRHTFFEWLRNFIDTRF